MFDWQFKIWMREFRIFAFMVILELGIIVGILFGFAFFGVTTLCQ